MPAPRPGPNNALKVSISSSEVAEVFTASLFKSDIMLFEIPIASFHSRAFPFISVMEDRIPAIPTWLVSIAILKFTAGARMLSKAEYACIKPCLNKNMLKDIF